MAGRDWGCAFTLWRLNSLIESETMRSYGVSEAATLASGRLTRLVFGPAVEVGIPEDRRIALFLLGVAWRAARRLS